MDRKWGWVQHLKAYPCAVAGSSQRLHFLTWNTLLKSCHKLEAKCSDMGAYRGHSIFRPWQRHTHVSAHLDANEVTNNKLTNLGDGNMGR